MRSTGAAVARFTLYIRSAGRNRRGEPGPSNPGGGSRTEMLISEKIHNMGRDPHNPVLTVDRASMRMELGSDLHSLREDEWRCPWDSVEAWWAIVVGDDAQCNEADWQAFVAAVRGWMDEDEQ